MKRKGSPGDGKGLNPVFKEINRLRNGIKGGNLRSRAHLAKFLIYEKELKKSLKQGVVLHATQKAEASKFLHLRPVWSTDAISGQPSLGS